MSDSLSHERWMAVGQFLKWVIVALLIVGILGALIVWLTLRADARAEEEQARKEAIADMERKLEEKQAQELKAEKVRIEEEKKARRERQRIEQKQTDDRDRAFVMCVQELGLDVCRLVEQHGLVACAGRGNPELTTTCVEDELTQTWNLMVEDPTGEGVVTPESVPEAP